MYILWVHIYFYRWCEGHICIISLTVGTYVYPKYDEGYIRIIYHNLGVYLSFFRMSLFALVNAEIISHAVFDFMY